MADRGCHAVTVPQHIGSYGQPPWQDPQWDVLWEAVCEHNTVVNIHIGTGGGVPVPSDQTTYLAYNSMLAIDTMRFTADLLFSPVVVKFPTIKFALSEGGIGWIPFLLERFEDIYSRQRAWTGDDLGDGLSPTDVFRRNFMSCFIRDRVGHRDARSHRGGDHLLGDGLSAFRQQLARRARAARRPAGRVLTRRGRGDHVA